jgi:hypothetical protein
MADKNFKSLLGKSSGTTFGELAGAYLSGKGKKNNRSRNIMIGTLLFNLKEDKMRSNVMKNLNALEDDKVLDQARLAKQWEEREKLQTEYETVKNKGAYNYYKADAETAFEELHGADEKYNLMGYQNEKINWMKDWSSKKEADLNKRYSGVDTDILTKEEFMSPVNDYYKAKQEDYLNPQNTSLVHKALGKIGFGTDRSETTNNFLNKKGEDTLLTFKNNKEEHMARINTLTSQDLAEINMSNFKYDKSPKITSKDFNTLLDENGMISDNNAEGRRSRKLAFTEWYSGSQSYASAQTAIANAVIGHDTNQTKAVIDEVTREYIAINGESPKLSDLTTLEASNNKDNWDRGLKKAIGTAFGIAQPLSEQRMERASELFELGLNMNLYEESERKEILQDIIDKDLRDATGAIDYNSMRVNIISENLLENLVLLRDKTTPLGMSSQAAINETSFVEKEDKIFLQNKLSIEAYGLLKDKNFDMIEFNKVKSAKDNKGNLKVSAVDEQIIRDLQESIWLSKGTRQANYAADAVISQIKELGL